MSIAAHAGRGSLCSGRGSLQSGLSRGLRQAGRRCGCGRGISVVLYSLSICAAYDRGLRHIRRGYAAGREEHDRHTRGGGKYVPDRFGYGAADPAIFINERGAPYTGHYVFMQTFRQSLRILSDYLGQLGEHRVHGVALRAMFHVRRKGEALVFTQLLVSHTADELLIPFALCH